jgi:hypothetical protein
MIIRKELVIEKGILIDKYNNDTFNGVVVLNNDPILNYKTNENGKLLYYTVDPLIVVVLLDVMMHHAKTYEDQE